MMRFQTVVAMFPDLRAAELTAWIERRWVQPEPDDGAGWIFHEIDVARVRLLYDLRHDFETPEETVPLVLSLLDQVYELRCQLKKVMHAVEEQPAEVRQAVLRAVGKSGAGS